jgi:hypothetical protein
MSEDSRGKMEPGPGNVIEPAFENGKPNEPDKWRGKLTQDRKKMMHYLQTGERYWYGESFGSERRKTKA